MDLWKSMGKINLTCNDEEPSGPLPKSHRDHPRKPPPPQMVLTWIFPLPLFSPDPLDLSAQTHCAERQPMPIKGVATLSPSWSAVVCYCGSSKYEVRWLHGQDYVTNIRQDSMNWITYNKSVRMVITWVRRSIFMCCWRTCFDACSQKMDWRTWCISCWIQENTWSVVDVFFFHMDVLRSTITEYVCWDWWISCKFLGQRWCERVRLLYMNNSVNSSLMLPVTYHAVYEWIPIFHSKCITILEYSNLTKAIGRVYGSEGGTNFLWHCQAVPLGCHPGTPSSVIKHGWGEFVAGNVMEPCWILSVHIPFISHSYPIHIPFISDWYPENFRWSHEYLIEPTKASPGHQLWVSETTPFM